MVDISVEDQGVCTRHEADVTLETMDSVRITDNATACKQRIKEVAVEKLASYMRSVPTAPPDMQDSEGKLSHRDVDDGTLWARHHCAMRGCRFHLHEENDTDFEQHLLDSHGQEFTIAQEGEEVLLHSARCAARAMLVLPLRLTVKLTFHQSYVASDAAA